MKASKVTQIVVKHIEPNPHNPRRLFDKGPLKILKESIERLGILVPITVYPRDKHKQNPVRDEFVILDGERRWRCAVSLEMNRMPAIIVEQPSEMENILTMFHIHNLRESWQLMPTALKLKVLMKKLDTTNERKLTILTRLSIGQIRRCRILLSYSERFQNLMLAPPTRRLKSDFFIELDRIRRHALKEKFPPWVSRGDAKCIKILLEKYMQGVIRAVTEFRKLAEIYRGSVRQKRVKQFYVALDKFLRDKDSGIDSIVVPRVSFEKETRVLVKSANRLRGQLSDLDAEVLASNNELVNSLKDLLKLIQTKLENAMVIGREREVPE